MIGKLALAMIAMVSLTLPLVAADAPKTQTITFENKLVDGKKTWLPKQLHVKSGAKVSVTFINTLAEPHGAEIPGLVPAMVVGPGETKTTEFTAGKKGKVAVKCHIHPAHVPASLVID